MLTTVSGSMLDHLPASAQERRRQIPVRAFLALLLSWALVEVGRGGWVPAWLAAAAAVQLFEFLAMRPFVGGRPRRWEIPKAVVAIVSTVAMSVAYCALASFFATLGGFVPLTMALLILAGGMLNNVASGVDSRPLFYIGVAPYVASLAAIPFLAVDRTSGLMPILVVTLLLFVVAVHAVWARTHRARLAEAAARAEAERRRAEAEEAVADRAAMAAIISHELRTPLSGIVAGAHLIRQSDVSETSRRTADLIADAGQLMTGLLNDLLDNAKIEARAMTLETADFDLVAALQDTARFWSAVARQKGLGFDTALPSQPLWLRGDAHRLRQILNNLLSNAIKFTDLGAVCLDLQRQEDGRFDIVVRDQGPGLSGEAMARLFTPYAQGSSEVARAYGGTGLGLTVSRDLARLMGGDVVARAPAAGAERGAEFVLSLSLPAGAPPGPLAPEPELLLPPQGLRVLAVDDHEINRRTLALVLQPLGVDLTTAIDGVCGLELLQSGSFDLVLMDVNMPGMDGLEATRRLRARSGPNQTVPVIGFSAGVEADQAANCRGVGMDDWIPKPLEPRRLYEAMARLTRDGARSGGAAA